MKYRADIDGLRAVSILLILVYHIDPSLLPGGYLGVDVFFVISGYLISSNIYTELLAQNFSFIHFYARRVRRIFPPLILVLAMALVAGWNGLFGHEFKVLGLHTFASAVFLSNFVYLQEAGYFDLASTYKPLLHLWSLAVEEQFYIVWPLLLFALFRIKARSASPGAPSRSVSSGAAVAFGLSLALCLGMAVRDPQHVFYFSPARAWELCAGAMLALFRLDLRRENTWHGSAPVGLALILGSALVLGDQLFHPVLLAVVPVAGATLVISSPGGRVGKLLSAPALVWVGGISYSLYLWHWPLLYFFRVLGWATAYPGAVWLVLPVSVLLAYGSLLVLERPIKHLPLLPVAAVLTATLLLVGGIGWNVYARNGMDFRERMQLEAFGGAPAENTLDCLERFKAYDPKFCRIQHSTRPVDVLILGDSIGHNAFEGVASANAKWGLNTAMLGWPGIAPVLLPEGVKNPYEGDRAAQVQHLIQDAARSSEWQKVLLVFRLPHELPAALSQQVGPTLEYFRQAGKPVLYFIAPPHLVFEPIQCFGMPPIRLKLRDVCAMQSAELAPAYHTDRAQLHNLLRDTHTPFFDAHQELCDDATCLLERDRRVLYRNVKYLTVEGSVQVYGGYLDKIQLSR